MAYLTNREHFIPFIVLNSGTPVTGLTRDNFTLTFFRDLTVCTLPVSVTEMGSGYYIATYTPNVPGFYYVRLTNVANSFAIENSIEIDAGSESTILTQDYGSTGALKPTVPNPEVYTLNIYTSKDWDLGNTGFTYVIGSTALDSSGNWITSSITVVPDTYHLVLQTTSGVVIVFRPYLNLTGS
jgi:hypothetical protein